MEWHQIRNRHIILALGVPWNKGEFSSSCINVFAGAKKMVRKFLAAAQQACACCTEGNTVPCHFAAGTVTTNRAGTAVAVVVRWFFTLQSSFSSSGACVV